MFKDRSREAIFGVAMQKRRIEQCLLPLISEMSWMQVTVVRFWWNLTREVLNGLVCFTTVEWRLVWMPYSILWGCWTPLESRGHAAPNYDRICQMASDYGFERMNVRLVQHSSISEERLQLEVRLFCFGVSVLDLLTPRQPFVEDYFQVFNWGLPCNSSAVDSELRRKTLFCFGEEDGFRFIDFLPPIFERSSSCNGISTR